MFTRVCLAQSMSICKCRSNNVLKLSSLGGQPIPSMLISKAPTNVTVCIRLPYPSRKVTWNATTSSIPTWFKEKCTNRLVKSLSLPLMPTKESKENVDIAAIRQRGVAGRTGEFLGNPPLPTYPMRSHSLSVVVVGTNVPVSCRMMSTLLKSDVLLAHSGLKSDIFTCPSSERKFLRQFVPSPSIKKVAHKSRTNCLRSTKEKRLVPIQLCLTAGTGHVMLHRYMSSSRLSSKNLHPTVVDPIMGTYMKIPYSKSSHRALKVVVLGAAGSLGQPLSLMLKQSPLIEELALYDVCNTKGMGLDISHVDTKCKVCAFTGEGEIEDALENSCIVLIVAGCPRHCKMKPEERFLENAKVVKSLCEYCAKVCPNALIGILTEPITSLVPVAIECFRKAGKYNPSRVFGITALDGVRANTFTAEILGQPPENVLVPVIGGCSGLTAVPLLSLSQPRIEFSLAERQRLTQSVQDAGSEMLAAEDGRACPALSLAFAAARFAISMCKGVCGQRSVVECAYVKSNVIEGCGYLTTPVELGPGGVQRNLGLPKLNPMESTLLKEAVAILKGDIDRGEKFVHDKPPPSDKPDKEELPPQKCVLNPVCIEESVPPPKEQ